MYSTDPLTGALTIRTISLDTDTLHWLRSYTVIRTKITAYFQSQLNGLYCILTDLQRPLCLNIVNWDYLIAFVTYCKNLFYCKIPVNLIQHGVQYKYIRICSVKIDCDLPSSCFTFTCNRRLCSTKCTPNSADVVQQCIVIKCYVSFHSCIRTMWH